jgi:hypothetical protein
MQTQKVTTIAGSLVTVATLCYLSLSSPSCEPYEDFFKETDVKQIIPWYDPNPYYIQYHDENLIGDQIEIIHQFVSLLIEKSEDLDPDYTAAVDKHFWDLV